jgi:hypothetical protein
MSVRMTLKLAVMPCHASNGRLCAVTQGMPQDTLIVSGPTATTFRRQGGQWRAYALRFACLQCLGYLGLFRILFQLEGLEVLAAVR